MSLKWENLTAPDFTQAIKDSKQTCVIPMGILERHSSHLPLGTDIFFAAGIAEMAAELEPVLIFPTFHFGQINEAKHFPGTIAIKNSLLFPLLENLCEEIARNGITKVVLLNGHGGNEHFISQFVLTMLEKPRSFTLYAIRLENYWSPSIEDPVWKEQMTSDFDHHAGEIETSAMLYLKPELVNMDSVLPGVKPLKRLAELNAITPIDWYADFPDHYAGDAAHATPEKGRIIMNLIASKVAENLKKIKADTETARLIEEFYARDMHGLT